MPANKVSYEALLMSPVFGTRDVDPLEDVAG